MTASKNTANEGGAATQTGINYQNRVAAWFAVRILAEDAVSRPWDFPERVEFLRCETEQPVDDLLLGLSRSGFVFIQVKHRLSVTKDSASAFAETIDQFVRQYIVSRSPTTRANPWQRPLSPDTDRLVCVTTSKSSTRILQRLPRLLERIRFLQTDLDPENAPTTRQDKELLDVFLQHVRRSWNAQLGNEPTIPQLRDFLHLIRFEVLDVATNGPAEREAKDVLQSSVLQAPSQTDSCWALLIDFCAEFAKNHSGADRKELLRLLRQVRITVKAPRSYADDVEHLKAYSSTTARAVRDLSMIRFRQREIKVARDSTKALYEAAEESSILVIGDPGAGKSGALYDFVQTLEREKRDHVFLAVDRLDAGSLTQIASELGLNHHLDHVLLNWQGPDCAFVVIDALDAARAEAAARAIKDLIAGILREESRWHVVASIRKFDLRYDEELKELFFRSPPPAVPSDFRDSEFDSFSHLKIPLLTDDELSQVFSQSPELAAVMNVISADLQELLRVPFNLKLLAQLVQEGVTRDELKPLRTQLQLLDKYWNYRVLRPPEQASAQELLLNRACERMIESRTLRVDWKSVADASGSVALDRLLSNHVLTEWQPSASSTPDRSLLMYSHHVLFDYAVARLVLRGNSSALVKRLADDPELGIVIRPSFLYHFRHLWTSQPDHNSFWELTFQIASDPTIPEIAKIIGPAVAAELVQSGSDFRRLLEWLQSDSQREVAETLIHHVVGAQLANPSAGNWGPWCEFLELVSRFLGPRTAYSINSLLAAVLEIFPSLSRSQKEVLGITARRVLDFAWAQSPRDGWLVIQGIRSVCRTFSSDPALSGALLRRALEKDHVAAFGFEELSWIARGIDEFVPYDPTLAEELYGAAFLHQETSAEPTPMGPSRIFSLVSNRKQDFEMARFQLAEAYSEFLARRPEHAARSMLLAAEGYVSRERNRDRQNEKERTFKVNNVTSGLRPDYSSIWDSGFGTQHIEALEIVSTFFDWLEQISVGADSTVDSIIAILAEKNRTALVWRRLLQLGTRRPETIGQKIVSLVCTVPMLTAFDTSIVAGEYLHAVFPLLTATHRLEMEHVILSLPQTNTDDKPEFSEKVRNRLLGCLPLEYVCDTKTKELIEQLRAAQAIPKNEPGVQFTGPFFKEFGEEEYLREQGVPVEAEVNKKIRALSNPVAAFATKHANSNPSKKEVLEVLPLMRALREALESANADGAHRLQIDHAWGQLTEACERMSRLSELHCDDESQSFVRNTLSQASTHRVPEPDPEQDQQFDETPSWGGPAARIAAAQGLANLCRIADCATPDVLSAVERLASDPVPAVRFQVVIRLNLLHETNRDLMWRILEQRCNADQSRGVLDGAAHLLGRLGSQYPDRAAALLATIFHRFEDEPKVRLRESCLAILSSLYVWRNQALSKQLVFDAIAKTPSNTAALSVIASQLRAVLTHGPVGPSDPGQDAVRHRGFDLLERILAAVVASIDSISQQQNYAGVDSWPKDVQEQVRDLLRVAAHIAKEVYFASGAFVDQQRQTTGARSALSLAEQKRFYSEAQGLLDKLASLGYPAISHTLLETLESFIAVDPRGVFLRISKTVRESRAGGYQYESMAVDLIVRMVERYLAEYRLVFQQDKESRQGLIELLDAFVRAGWPAARRIAYRLEEIFR